MKLKIANSVLMLLCIYNFAFAQEPISRKEVSSLTIFYIDNSQTPTYSKISPALLENLKERVESSQNDEEDYFLAYLSDGEESKFSNDEKKFLDKDLSEFLDKKIRSVDYTKDKELFRDFFIAQLPLKVKKTVEINFYLSALSVYNMKNKITDIPTPLSLISEIPLYLNNNSVIIKVNYFITAPSELVTDRDFNTKVISELIGFYLDSQFGGRIRPKIEFL